MSSKSYCYQFSDQKVFASENAPLSFQLNGNYAIVSMNNYTVGVYDISNNNFTLINVFPVCGCVIKSDYCVIDDYIITLESKDHAGASSYQNNSVRTYHNWRNGGPQNKIRFRSALGPKVSNPLSAHSGNPDKPNALGESSFLENVVEVLEFLHLNHPLCFSIYANSTSSKIINTSYEDISSNIAISESTYVHLYHLCHPRNSFSTHSGVPSKVSITKSNEIDPTMNNSSIYFQHLYTVNFSFVVYNVSLLSNVLVAASNDKAQAIQMLEEKQKSDMFSSKMENENWSSISKIDLDIDKCWLTSISNARKKEASKPRVRPKEILGPTQNLDTASITLLRYTDSKEMSFETLLFRNYASPSTLPIIQNIHLVKVLDFDELGLFIVTKHEIVHYSFFLKKNEVFKIAEYDFREESVLSMAFSDHVNLIHVAFANGDLATYNSRLCVADLFQSSNVSKRVSLTRLGKVNLMGLTDVKSNGLFLCACCKFNFTEENEAENAVIISPDSWNFYLFSQPPKEEIKKSIIAHATHKGNRKLLQMLLCSLLVFPSKSEISNKVIEEIIICCLKSEVFYMELVPILLLRSELNILDALKIFQVLETKELYDAYLFELYVKQKLIKSNFDGLNEDHFRWIVIKILECSINLLFQVIVTNYLENFLKADLLVIEGLNSETFESNFIKIIYYSAHTDYDLVEPLLGQLDQDELKKLIKCHSQLIYNHKHHTSFGWALNLYAPQIYAEIVASCFLNEMKDNNEFANLEIAKQVGQCSHMLVLEEILYMCLKSNGLITNSSKYCRIKFQNDNEEGFIVGKTQKNDSKNCANITESYRHYINQLILLYHEFSFNVIEFCPHKFTNVCRKIPLWLKSLRYHSILNQFYPFNGTDPFNSPHNSNDGVCSSICCQSYLIRLQCLMSWKESFKLDGKNVIEASCESMNHPAWKSLNFLLMQHSPLESRNTTEIINFISSMEKHKDCNFVDLYFSTFGSEITTSDWRMIVEGRSNNVPLGKILKYASTTLNLDEYLSMILTLKESKIIGENDYMEWVERSGRLSHRNKLFNSLFNQIIQN